MPIDPQVLRRLLRAIERCVRVLRALRAAGRDAFLNDEAVQDRAAHNAQLLAQACADIALHILAASGAAAPETYAGALEALGSTGVIDVALARRLASAVRLRNILVHGYLDLDHGRLYDELNWIDDAVTFAVAIERWIEAQERSGE